MAYSQRHYRGNLLDILTTPEANHTPGFERNPHRGTVIDNHALEGFLDYFMKHDCACGCGNCSHCSRYTSRALTRDAAEACSRAVNLDAELSTLFPATGVEQ